MTFAGIKFILLAFRAKKKNLKGFALFRIEALANTAFSCKTDKVAVYLVNKAKRL